ncbi:extracellular solute-binding protein [Paenibacillus sp. MBLB4367]|uniref:extracellular solute-binding protein n=1 Tax=Paenibacillus sp. MBLB4367 TaxID=3384767 RepID=UPI0039084373
MKKSLLVTTIVAVAAVTGCSQSPKTEPASTGSTPETFRKTGLPIVEKQVSLRIPVVKADYHKNWDEMATIRDLEDKTNVNINWEQIPAASFQEKKNLMFTSGDIPDAFFNGLNSQDVVKYGSQGVLIPLEGLIEKYAPNIKKILDENPQVRRLATAPDGHIYSIPWFEDKSFFEFRNAFLINKKWLDKLQLKVPTTTEELYQVLKAFKEKDPNGNGKADEIPATFRHGASTNGYYELFGAFGVVDALTMFSVDNKKVVFDPMQAGYKEGIKFINKLYSEGLFDKETFTQDAKQMLSKTQSNPQLVGLVASFNGVYEFGNEGVKDYVAIPALKGPNGDQLWRRQDNRIIQNFFSITSANKNPEVTMRLVDTMNDPKSVLQFQRGPIGTHLKERSDGMFEVIDAPKGTDTSSWIGSVSPSTALPLMISKDWVNKLVKNESDQLRQNFYEIYKPNIVKEDRAYPNLYLTAEQNNRMSVLNTDISTYIRKMEAKWIIDGNVEKEWDGFTQELKKMGIEEMIKIKQAAYDAFIKN